MPRLDARPRDTAHGERLDPRVGRGFGSEHAERNGELPPAGVDDGQIVDREQPQLGRTPVGGARDGTGPVLTHHIGSAATGRCDTSRPSCNGSMSACARARSASENGPHSTQTSASAATLPGASAATCCDVSTRIAIGLHLRAEPSRLRSAPRDRAAHSRTAMTFARISSRTARAHQRDIEREHEHAFEHEIIDDLDRRGEMRRDVGCAAAGE